MNDGCQLAVHVIELSTREAVTLEGSFLQRLLLISSQLICAVVLTGECILETT